MAVSMKLDTDISKKLSSLLVACCLLFFIMLIQNAQASDREMSQAMLPDHILMSSVHIQNPAIFVSNPVTPTSGIVSGRVWHDTNQNYQIDDDEQGIASVPITLTIGYSIHDCINPPLGCYQIIDTTITSSIGYYTLQKFEITCWRCALGLEIEPPPQYPFATLTAGSLSLHGDDLDVNLGFFEGYQTWLPLLWR